MAGTGIAGDGLTSRLTPKILLRAYAAGIFPMAESADAGEIHWVDPSRRGIIPLDNFHISRSLARVIRREMFEMRFNTAFEQVLSGCADRDETWINPEIYNLYVALHHMGYAHSQEVWLEGHLVGGVYGVALGGAFFGESMFSRATNASKVALAYLVDRLRLTGFSLFDTQFVTPHLLSLGAVEIPRSTYLDLLETALGQKADIRALGAPQSGQDVMQRNGQIS